MQPRENKSYVAVFNFIFVANNGILRYKNYLLKIYLYFPDNFACFLVA